MINFITNEKKGFDDFIQFLKTKYFNYNYLNSKFYNYIPFIDGLYPDLNRKTCNYHNFHYLFEKLKTNINLNEIYFAVYLFKNVNNSYKNENIPKIEFKKNNVNNVNNLNKSYLLLQKEQKKQEYYVFNFNKKIYQNNIEYMYIKYLFDFL